MISSEEVSDEEFEEVDEEAEEEAEVEEEEELETFDESDDRFPSAVASAPDASASRRSTFANFEQELRPYALRGADRGRASAADHG